MMFFENNNLLVTLKRVFKENIFPWTQNIKLYNNCLHITKLKLTNIFKRLLHQVDQVGSNLYNI